MASKYFRKALAEVKPEERRYVDKNLDIVEQIVAILNERDMSQRDLAQQMGKTEAEVSRMLSGLHNLTLKTLARLEVALGEDIITTPQKARELTGDFKQAKVFSFVSHTLRQAAGAETYRTIGKQSAEMEAYGRETQKVKSASNTVVDFKRNK
jgi:transcriptional regulator with XRE-family HTH domain